MSSPIRSDSASPSLGGRRGRRDPGGVIQVVLARARELPVTESRKFRVANVSQTVLEFAPDGSVVLKPGW